MSSGVLDMDEPLKNNIKQRNHKLIWFSILLIFAALIWLLYWLFYLRFHEFTDDAYANGNFITINSAINGSVVAFYTDDTNYVREGQLLVQLDTTPYQLIYDKELATLNSVILNVRQLFNTVKANQAIVESKQATLNKAIYDYENRLQLAPTLAISNEMFVHARDDLLVAQLELEQAKAQYQVSVDALGSLDVKIKNHPLIQKQMAVVREAYYQLKHCSIYAPSTGYIAQRTVDVGVWVTPSTPLMSLIPVDYVWVDANFKETELTNMRVGQPASVWFDLYGSKIKYSGHVIGIGLGSGSVFSLIPPQNATGNWIKIVQRLPVRISLDPDVVKEYPVRLGISAEVCVNTTNRSLPFLSTIPLTEPVAMTKIFDLSYDEVNAKMDEMIQANTSDSEKNDTRV